MFIRRKRVQLVWIDTWAEPERVTKTLTQLFFSRYGFSSCENVFCLTN